MSEPLEHVERLKPPWRTLRLTECGHEITEFRQVVTYDDLVAKIKAQGKQRAAMSTCMTCWSKCTFGRHDRWENDPSGVVARDANGRREDLLAGELRALAVLWEAHQDEYADIVASLDGTSDLDARRAARAYKNATGR